MAVKSKTKVEERWIVGYLDKENVLRDAFLFKTKDEAMQEFAFDPENPDGDLCTEGSVTSFLARIIRKQNVKEIRKYITQVIDVEKQEITSETEIVFSSEDKD